MMGENFFLFVLDVLLKIISIDEMSFNFFFFFIKVKFTV